MSSCTKAGNICMSKAMFAQLPVISYGFKAQYTCFVPFVKHFLISLTYGYNVCYKAVKNLSVIKVWGVGQ